MHYGNGGAKAEAVATAAVHRAGVRHGLRVTTGRKVVELRPNMHRDKGKTPQRIVDRITGRDSLLPIYLGDDLTDQDASTRYCTTGSAPW